MTTEVCVLLRENALHTHPPSQVQAQVDRVVKKMWSMTHVGEVRLVHLRGRNESRRNEM